MDPRGWVFLGYSESLWQVTERFHLVRVGTAFAYRQPEAVPVDAAAQLLPAPGYPSHSRGPSKRTKSPVSAAALDAGRSPAVRGAATYAEARGGSRPSVPAGAKLGSIHAPSAASTPHAAPAPSPPRGAVEATNQCGGDPSIAALLAAGEAGLQAGDAAAAVAALRKVVYLDPDHAIAQFQLGLAFELQGETRQARRAFSVARAALGRSSAAAEVALEGYQIEELVRMIDHRLTRTPEP